MRAGKTIAPESSRPRLHSSFQSLLLTLAEAAGRGENEASIIGLFCRSTREFFKVDGVYFWRSAANDELIGTEADGHMAAEFPGMRLKAKESAVAADAVQSRQTVYVNELDASSYPKAADFGAQSMMAAPLVIGGDVIGAMAFLHRSNPKFFTDDLAAKATILAGQMGQLLEAARLTRISREQHRRAEILVECAQVLRAAPDMDGVIQALAERLRVLVQARVVLVLLPSACGMAVRAMAADSPTLGQQLIATQYAGACRLAQSLAPQLSETGEPVVVQMAADEHELAQFSPSRAIIAAPLRGGGAGGLILVCPGQLEISEEEKSLVAAVAGFGALTLANAELFATASARANELHQLLEISSELGGSGNLDRFLQQFVVRAAEFLGFGRSYIALTEGDSCHVRWVAEKGVARPLQMPFPASLAKRVLAQNEVFWSDDLGEVPETSASDGIGFELRQILSVPLLGPDGKALGMFGVLDRLDKAAISAEDIRRARALAGPVAVVLEAARNLHLSEQHRRRAEALMGLALELNSTLRLPEFTQSFTARAADMLGAGAAALALAHGKQFEIAVLQPAATPDNAGPRRLAIALTELIANRPQAIFASQAAELLGPTLATALGWSDLILARLHSGDGELMGMLCLANRGKPLAPQEEYLLQALAGHAAVALENARLFTRMDQANRHWMEIFDAISDFILVHDHNQKVLRVNRSLAEFIGVPPGELIGVSVAALLAMTSDAPLHSCPFCGPSSERNDEFIHPVLERTYLVSNSQIHGPNSEGLQTIHVLKDITDRREAERRYRELFDNIQEGLFFCSPDGGFVEVNDALVRMLGYGSRDALLQADLSRELYFSEEARERLRTRLEEQGAVRNYEEVLRRKDGTAIHTLQNAFAVRDAQGRMVQFRGVILDISELKSSQSELQRERDFNHKILNNTQSIIMVLDRSGQVSYANRRWYEVIGHEQPLLGHPLTEVVVPSRRAALNAALEAILEGQQVENLELPVLRGDGCTGQFSISLSPMRDEQGRVMSIVVVMTDITDSAMLQAKLMHTEKLAAVGQLVSGVVHEVNNPLTAILGFADLLMENPDLPENARNDLRVILQEAQRTKDIVQNLLSFARQMPPQRKPVQLNTILRRTLQLRAYDLSSHGVQVTEQYGEDLPEVVGDSHQLQQVFLNILNNAYDAVSQTGRPARIEVETSRGAGYVQVLFRDNGHGIAYPERIFDPFFTTKEVGKGTGLGLSICYGIVREHGGEILCLNNVGREGATFVVRLPVTAGITETTPGAGAATV
jgi:PAS domain S-box-containing protein